MIVNLFKTISIFCEFFFLINILQPQASSVYTALEGSYTSNYGIIKSAWSAVDGVITAYDVTVPANTEATLYLPIAEGTAEFGEAEGASYIQTTEWNGLTVAEYQLTSGSYSFENSETGVSVL